MAGPLRSLRAAPAGPVTLLDRLLEDGFELKAAGDRLRIRPLNRVTPELRAELERHKLALLVLLEPNTDFVMLQGGLIVPVPALVLALDVEARGFEQTLDAGGEYRIEPVDRLTDVDRAAISRWRRHLAAMVAYEPPTCA